MTFILMLAFWRAREPERALPSAAAITCAGATHHVPVGAVSSCKRTASFSKKSK